MAKELAEQKPKLQDSNVKLCRAIEKHRCVYDREQPHSKDALNEAWEDIAVECRDSVSSCKARWGKIRTAFMRSRQQTTSKKRQANKSRDYYLNDVLNFYIPYMSVANKNSKDEHEPPLERSRKVGNFLSLRRKTTDQDEGTTSADEATPEDAKSAPSTSSKSKVNTFFIKESSASKVGTFIIKKTDEAEKKFGQGRVSENDEILALPDKSPYGADEVQKGEDTREVRFKRACKRDLYKTVDQQPKNSEPKRTKRSIVARRATLATVEVNGWGGPRTSPKPKSKRAPATTQQEKAKQQQPKKPASQKAPTIKAKPLKQMLPPVEPGRIGKDLAPSQGSQTVDQAVQHDGDRPLHSGDNEFLNSLRPQMTSMTERQKLHFKQKVYQSLIEVLESESTTVPNIRQLQDGTPDGVTNDEMNLIRKLVTLVQAAKHTPEYMNSNEQCQAEVSGAPSTSKDSPTPTTNYNNSNRRVISFRSSTRQQHEGTNDDEAPLRKIVKVSGKADTPDNEKRRVYRILPKNSVIHSPFLPSPSAGTFVITTAAGPIPSTNTTPISTDPPSFNASGNGSTSSNVYRQVPVSGGTILVRNGNPNDILGVASPPKLRPLVTVCSGPGRPWNSGVVRKVTRRYSTSGSDNMDKGESGSSDAKYSRYNTVTTSINTSPSMSSKIDVNKLTTRRVVRAVSSMSPFKFPSLTTTTSSHSSGTRATLPTSLNQFLSLRSGTSTGTTMMGAHNMRDTMGAGLSNIYSSALSFPLVSSVPIRSSPATATSGQTTVINMRPITTRASSATGQNVELSPAHHVHFPNLRASENIDPLHIKEEPM